MRLKKVPFPLVVGFISALKLNLIGDIYIGEIIAIGYVIVNFSKLRLSHDERTIAVFGLLWAISQFISDVTNGAEVNDSIKGVLAPLVFLITFTFLVNYIRNKIERLPLLLVGFTAGAFIQILLFPNGYFINNPWKWGVGSFVISGLVIYFSFFAKNKSFAVLFFGLLVFAFVSLFFDARSMAIFPIFSALIYLKFFGKNASAINRIFSGNLAGLKVLFVLVPVLILINFASSALFSSSLILSNLSSSAAAKYKTQATGAYGILLGGRSEFIISGEAFLDKPLLGHGSWAKDKSGYLDRYSILRYQLGYSLRDDGQYEEVGSEVLIPTHSFLMGAFVWAGVLGGLFWLVLLNIVVKLFVKNMNLLPLYFYVGGLAFIWSVFFSPFGASGRWGAVIFLAAFFSYVNYLKDNRRASL